MSVNSTFVFFKATLNDTEVGFDITPMLRYGETLTSVIPQSVSPVSTPPLVVTRTSAIDSPEVQLLLTGGSENVSYGIPVTITTTARVLSALCAVTVATNTQVPYTTENPEAYTDLVDSVEAGKAAVSTAIFSFPTSIDPSGGYVNWELLSADGVVYASGNAFEYSVTANGLINMVVAKSVINVPSSVPPSLNDQKYQIRYTLTLNAGNSDQQQYFSYESVTVVGLSTVPVGTQPSVELQGSTATLELVTEQLYDEVYVELYSGNNLLASQRIPDFQRVSSGYYYCGTFDTTQLQVSLLPYHVVWRYKMSGQPAPYTESSFLWIVNPSIMGAVDDVKSMVNKARTTLYGSPDLLFPVSTILTWLRRAGDNFNGSYGVFTAFTFTNALGPIREYWLMYAEMLAVTSQYLAEGEKAFDFAGANISLNVDKTQYFDNLAGKIQARLDNEFKPFKQNLVIKGNTRGDGSADPSRLQRGAMGAVGITITPASPRGIRTRLY